MRFIFAFERGRKEDHIRKVHCEASLSRYFKVLLWLILLNCFDMDVLDTGENAELLALQRIDGTCVELQEQGSISKRSSAWRGTCSEAALFWSG